MRGLFGILALAMACVSLVLASPGRAEDGGKAWRAVRPAPGLHLRFEDRGEAAPCPTLGATPVDSVVECWAAYVDRSVAKQSSPLATDLRESDVREYGLSTGLVDNKICAIDEDWSGLRFVVRRKDRPR